MDKRDRFINELRDTAKAKGFSFSVDKGRGKGGHCIVRVGEKVTILPSREIDPVTAGKIRKKFGLT